MLKFPTLILDLEYVHRGLCLLAEETRRCRSTNIFSIYQDQFLIPYLFSSKILRTILINRQNLSTAKIWRITCKMTCKSPWHAVHRAKSTRHLSPHPQTDKWADASHCHVLVYHNTLQFGPADSLHTVWTGHLESLPSVRDGVEMGQVI